MELIFEIFFEVYLELMLHIVSEEKAFSPLYRVLAIIIAVIMTLGNFALFVWGGILLLEDHNLWGWIPIAIATVLSLTQIILGFALDAKKRK